MRSTINSLGHPDGPWRVEYYRSGSDRYSTLMPKWAALAIMKEVEDAVCIEKVCGWWKRKIRKWK